MVQHLSDAVIPALETAAAHPVETAKVHPAETAEVDPVDSEHPVEEVTVATEQECESRMGAWNTHPFRGLLLMEQTLNITVKVYLM